MQVRHGGDVSPEEEEQDTISGVQPPKFLASDLQISDKFKFKFKTRRKIIFFYNIIFTGAARGRRISGAGGAGDDFWGAAGVQSPAGPRSPRQGPNPIDYGNTFITPHTTRVKVQTESSFFTLHPAP